MLGIITALRSEAEFVLKASDETEKLSDKIKETYLCSISGKKAVLIISGIGKVNAALSAQYLIDKYNITTLINFGTAGGIGKAKAKEYYAVDKCCQPDFDVRLIDDVPLGYIQDYDRVYFPAQTDKLSFLPTLSLASADRFSNDANFINDVKNLGCDLRDMEGAAISQVCLANSIPFYSIKGVTDVYGNNNDGEQFLQNLSIVCNGFIDIVKKVISKF